MRDRARAGSDRELMDAFESGPSILDAYYPAEVLASDLARKVFVLPRR